MKYLITGGSGFLGAKVFSIMKLDKSAEIHLAVRNKNIISCLDAHVHDGFNLENIDCWNYNLSGIDILIHTAGLAHIFCKNIDQYRLINTVGTLKLAKKAADSGVKRFIFISSIKVNGDETVEGKKFTAEDIPQPKGAYALSKYNAELGLLQLSKITNMEIVIIRPPLVYGPGVKGNFLSLVNYIKLGYPIPLLGVKNKRSLISIDNLANFITVCANHPFAGNNIFLVSDGYDMSTPELINKISFILGLKSNLIYIPNWLLRGLLFLVRKSSYSGPLFNSLQIDMHKSLKLLDWKPSVTVDDSLVNTLIN